MIRKQLKKGAMVAITIALMITPIGCTRESVGNMSGTETSTEASKESETKASEKHTEKSTQKASEKTTEKSTKATEETTEEGTETITESSTEETPAEIPAETTEEMPAETPVDTSAETPVETPVESYIPDPPATPSSSLSFMDSNAISSEYMWYVRNYNIDCEGMYQRGRALRNAGDIYDIATAVAREAYNIGGRNCIEYAFNSYFMCMGAGIECYFARNSVPGWYGHTCNMVNLAGEYFYMEPQLAQGFALWTSAAWYPLPNGSLFRYENGMDIIQDIYGNSYTVDKAYDYPEAVYNKIGAEFFRGWNEECKNIEGATPLEVEDEELHQMAKTLRNYNYGTYYFQPLKDAYEAKIENKQPGEGLAVFISNERYSYTNGDDASEYGRRMCQRVYNYYDYKSVDKIGIQFGHYDANLDGDIFGVVIYGKK